MSNLAAFRTSVLELLNDPSKERYSDNQVDQALRWALGEYSVRRPHSMTYALDATGARTLALPADFEALFLIRLQLTCASPDDYQELGFYGYKVDGDWVIVLNQSVAAGGVLLLTYAAAQTIDDLDGAAGTSLPAQDEALVQLGAAGRAMQSRITTLVENNNLSRTTARDLFTLSDSMLSLFATSIAPIGSSRTVPLPAVPTDIV
jgi:hypothetical protein